MEILGIYDGEAGILGEIKYGAQKILGIKECSLCNITHKGVSKKKSWLAFQKKFGLDVKLVYLNQQDKDLKEFTNQKVPCIVGKQNNGYVMLIDSVELEKLQGNVEDFFKLLKEKLSKI